MTKRGYKQTPEHVARRIKSGPESAGWKGDAVSVRGGRSRALRRFPLIGPCVRCGDEKAERHHRDGNTANNEPDNIEVLCRRCHMADDGRLDRVRTTHGGGAIKGADHANSVLTDDDIRSIRQRYAAGGVLQRELATEFGVSQSLISRIIHRKAWAHVE